MRGSEGAMIVKSAKIRNFRCLRDVTLNFGRQTVLVGGNGEGKSSILRAIELFYLPSLSAIQDIDFYDRKNPIEIELTFTEFTDTEKELFEGRIFSDEMRVARIIPLGGGKNSGRYYGVTPIHPGFGDVLSAEGNQRKIIFNAIEREGIYADLEKAAKIADIDSIIDSWQKAHPEQCVLGRDSGQFLGFTNVGRGALQRATSFVLIPAVRDAAADALDGKTSAIGQLMELIVRSAIQSRKDIQDFQKRISDEYKKLTDPENLMELGGLAEDISATLQQLYSDTAVSLYWKKPEDFSMPLPGADVALRDDKIDIPVDRAGHGLQRAFIISLLQHLARARAVNRYSKSAESDSDLEAPDSKSIEPVLPGLILAIEEPELYQHPTKQRHFARVLNELSRGLLPGMATTTQLMFATHSPYFVALDRFEEIRLLRRTHLKEFEHKETICNVADLSSVARSLEEAAGKPKGTFSASTLKPRLHIIGPELAEGFFAKLVVLVEGPSDKAALFAAASLRGVNFEAEGIAILAVEGKDKIDRPWAIFTSLGIPVYTIWDSDKSKKGSDAEKAIKGNKLLQKLLNVPEPHVDFPAAITKVYSCFEDELEFTLLSELGVEFLNDLIEKKTIIFELPKRDDALKNPDIMRQILAEAAEAGHRSQSLDAIIDNILALKT